MKSSIWIAILFAAAATLWIVSGLVGQDEANAVPAAAEAGAAPLPGVQFIESEARTHQRELTVNGHTAATRHVRLRAALPYLKQSDAGRIVNVGANGALKSAAGMGAYAASKAAVHRLTESLAEELKSSTVTVNAVLPSILDTPQNRADMPDADPAKWVAPADLAAVILFLASPEARAVTGALIPVTGKV